jgi:hypothetical protein
VATQWPVVHARLVALLPTLAGWESVRVFDGPPVTGETPDAYVTVGYALGEDTAGTFSHERAGNGFQVEETGEVRCELVAVTGATDLASVRTRAFALIDAFEETIRADQRLGVLTAGSTSSLVVDVLPAQTTAGAQQRLPFSLNYFVRT